MKVVVETEVDVVDEKMLRAYTSGFMPKDATVADRVRELIKGPHVIGWQLNGIKIIETRARILDPMIAHVPLTEDDITYGLLNTLRDKLMDEDTAWPVDADAEYHEAVIDDFLKQYPTRDQLIEWGKQFANGDVDEEHAVWSMDHFEAEEYAIQRVTEILEGTA